MKYKKILTAVLLAIIILLLLPPAVYYIGVTLSNETNGLILSGGEKRSYLIHIPQSYTGKKSVPLVLSFHGFAEWPAHHRDTSGWNAIADREGFIVVYPEATGFPRRWRTRGKPGTGKKNDPQTDITFVSDLIDHLEKKYAVDPHKIYANGLSNGGGMSHMLACMLSNRIKAIAGVAGAYTFSKDACTPPRRVPMIIFHGINDRIVPYYGGTSGGFALPDIKQFASEWAAESKCKKKNNSQVSPSVHLTEFTSCEKNALVAVYTISGGGHTWPGGKPLPEFIAGITNYEIQATELIWKFFTAGK